MKNVLIIVLVIAGISLAVVWSNARNEVAAQKEQIAGTETALADCSNRIESAQAQIAEKNLALGQCSNRLDESSASLVSLSNQLAAAQAALPPKSEEISRLTGQLTAVQTEKKIGEEELARCTNQLAAVSEKLAATAAQLDQAGKDYALLDNRFHRDVAERVVLERKFNRIPELEAQRVRLQTNAGQWATEKNIYDSLDVEVKPNGVAHVIAPN